MTNNPTLTPRERRRRVAHVYLLFARNLACYRAGLPVVSSWPEGAATYAREFWFTANSNSLDIAVLEWCKILADPNGKHHWSLVVSDVHRFEAGLLSSVCLTANEFAEYCESMRRYRDKFLAHLDSDLVMHIPKLDTAKVSADFYYNFLCANDAEAGDLLGLPSTPDAVLTYVTGMESEAAVVYGGARG
jgi:hypothetical protein